MAQTEHEVYKRMAATLSTTVISKEKIGRQSRNQSDVEDAAKRKEEALERLIHARKDHPMSKLSTKGIGNMERVNNFLKHDEETIDNRFTFLEGRIGDMEAQHRHELELKDNLIAVLRKATLTLEQEKTRYITDAGAKAKLDKALEDGSNLRNELADLKSAAKENERNMSRANRQLKSAEGRAENAEKEVESLRNEMRTKDQVIPELERDIRTEQAKCAGLEKKFTKQVEELKTSKEGLEAKYESKRKESTWYHHVVTTLLKREVEIGTSEEFNAIIQEASDQVAAHEKTRAELQTTKSTVSSFNKAISANIWYHTLANLASGQMLDINNDEEFQEAMDRIVRQVNGEKTLKRKMETDFKNLKKQRDDFQELTDHLLVRYKAAEVAKVRYAELQKANEHLQMVVGVLDKTLKAAEEKLVTAKILVGKLATPMIIYLKRKVKSLESTNTSLEAQKKKLTGEVVTLYRHLRMGNACLAEVEKILDSLQT